MSASGYKQTLKGRNRPPRFDLAGVERLPGRTTTKPCVVPNLSNRLREKLFTGYGPLSSFSAKIDIAYSLNLITENLKGDLHILREIRNEFAHSTVMLHFDTDEMKALLTKFSDYDPKMDRLAFYLQKLGQCFEGLRPATGTRALSVALRQHKPGKADTSPEKSR